MENTRQSELLESALEWIYDHIPTESYTMQYRDTLLEGFVRVLHKHIGMSKTETEIVIFNWYGYGSQSAQDIIDDEYDDIDYLEE